MYVPATEPKRITTQVQDKGKWFESQHNEEASSRMSDLWFLKSTNEEYTRKRKGEEVTLSGY